MMDRESLRLAIFGFARWAIGSAVIAGAVCATLSAQDTTSGDFFEARVRPLLIDRCIKCHGSRRQSGGLRLDTREGALSGGDSGAAVVPGKPGESLMIQAVQRRDGLEMPPADKDALRESQVAALVAWIRDGAVWPGTQGLDANDADEQSLRTPDQIVEASQTHWAFQPLAEVEPPSVDASRWSSHPIDAFVHQRREAAGLRPSPPASYEDLIRRTAYTLTGLPPTISTIQSLPTKWRTLPDADARSDYLNYVDRLLESPQYGEHWARQWLDIARYSDTKGYVYAREERFWVHAWPYRDWVARAFQEDMPYDRFLLLQLAADQVRSARPDDMAAMGFLTLGRRFLGVPRDIIDDRIDVVTRGTMALTVACARCHDHKYDAIPTADYYSLYGVFASCSERLVDLPTPAVPDDAFQSELKKRLETLQTKTAKARLESADRVRARVADYLKAQTELQKYPPQGFDQVFQPTDMLPAFVRQWQAFLHRADRDNDPVFVIWHSLKSLPEGQFTEVVETKLNEVRSQSHPLVAAQFKTPPASFDEVIQRYGELFDEARARWEKLQQQASNEAGQARSELADPQWEALRRVLYGSGSPCEVPDEGIVHTETFFPSSVCTDLWKTQGEVDRHLIRASSPPPYALTLVDRDVPFQPRVFRRGNPLNLGEEVPRQFPALLSGKDRKPFTKGSGRLELAQQIVSPENPLTARVIVNRVWASHFGQGLVPTTSDFGLRAPAPSHPLLLDYLTRQFIANRWSLKWLHRTILTSETFRQASTGPSSVGDRQRAMKQDPQNRLLWRVNARRLTFEAFRDSLLAASDDLDLQVGGKPVELFKPPYAKRRTIYGLVDRQFLPSTLRVFDFANPDLHVARRSETTVPQQALYFMNHPFVVERAQRVAETALADVKRVTKPDNLEAALRERSFVRQVVQQLFLRSLRREPSETELNDALGMCMDAKTPVAPAAPPTAKDWQYGYGSYDETSQRTRQFDLLPHFTGSAYQGSAQWPDAKHGWAQLTADGGHPGNTREHACIRRWIAPREMDIEIQSKFVHNAPQGDGVRAFIVSSKHGRLAMEKLHQQSKAMDVESRRVQAGETIDFLVDIDQVLNSDQFLWDITVREVDGARWHAASDFPNHAPTRLTPIEQLAHILLCTNEFFFVD